MVRTAGQSGVFCYKGESYYGRGERGGEKGRRERWREMEKREEREGWKERWRERDERDEREMKRREMERKEER